MATTNASRQADAVKAAPADPVKLAKKIAKDKRNAGTQAFVNAGEIFEQADKTFTEGFPAEDALVSQLAAVVYSIVHTNGLVQPPVGALQRGTLLPDANGHTDPYFTKLLSALTFKHATGWSFRIFARRPGALQLLRQVVIGLAAAAAPAAFGQPLEVIVEWLEDAFFYLAAPREQTVSRCGIEELLGERGDAKVLQFAIMQALCALYRQLFETERTSNVKYLFRHAEAASILVLVNSAHYRGHAELSWSFITRVTSGIVHVTPESWQQARMSAKRAVALAAEMGHEWSLVPAAYDLAFLLAAGFPEEQCDRAEIRRLLADVEKTEQRLEAWGMRERARQASVTRRYMVAITREWVKGLKGAAAAKGGGDCGPVTDWRCFDQRNQGFYTWLEPPVQAEPVKCAQCGTKCLLHVHRCHTCKLVPYCNSICAAAHVFDHRCEAAPKPWLSPPGGAPPPAPAELGEEGFLGAVPWPVVRYGAAAAACYAVYYLWLLFDGFRLNRQLGVQEGLVEVAKLAVERLDAFMGRAPAPDARAEWPGTDDSALPDGACDADECHLESDE